MDMPQPGFTEREAQMEAEDAPRGYYGQP